MTPRAWRPARALLAVAVAAAPAWAAARAAAPLPDPLPPPERAPAPGPVGTEAGDPLELVWSHRIQFAAGGAPLVTVRLVEGQAEIAFRPLGPARLVPRGGAAYPVAAGEPLRARAEGALPAVLAHWPLVGIAQHADRARLDAIRATWEARGVAVRQRLTGGVYGVAGRVIDNRRAVLVADGEGSLAGARAFGDRATAEHGARTEVFSEVVTRPSGRVQVDGPSGRRLADGDALVALEVEGDAGFAVGRGRDERAYRGRLLVTIDASGRLAAVAAVPVEELLRGLVPSEIPAGSPREALRAQAVTARSNVLAQIGTRHLTDPYVLCNEVHCQAYRGRAAENAATDRAVRDTAGEALFGRADRVLVDAVYSAVCGGHGEDNDAVWPQLPDRSLRGRPDLPEAAAERWAGGLADEARLRAFLRDAPAGWCARARGGPRERYRWERRFGAAELDAAAAPLGVGRVRTLEVTARGASGRALALRVTGEDGQATVEGELRIRALLANLPSAMFVVDRQGEGVLLRGGGWGHGVGMCQWGAVGRAEAGQGYREILRAYYSGAEVARMY